MKFKILKETETFEKLMKLKERIISVNEQAADAIKLLGATKYCKAQNRLAGGVCAIEFEKKPDGYRRVGDRWSDLYYPKVSNKIDSELLQTLPTMDYKELNDIINFEGNQTIAAERGMFWIHTVGLTWGENEILIDVENGCKYDAPTDVVEILESEYLKLKEKK